ncbi:threonine aldolase family protein [Maritalea myrionectae]|uniref:threonine aldolase family protein n=1 Tax=Maritalea myrionectae TaxID=454601 RepID=UPI000484CC3A|nr:GntG family PLP-dependent aldolase [Maritalea myrionectae]
MPDREAVIDLRSDTVTKPCAGMLAAMAEARVGDDQYGEDIETNLLQDEVAQLLGKERALWLPSGTMANQVAMKTTTQPGDDVIVAKQSHAVWHETGGSAANAGVQFSEIGEQGWFIVDAFDAAIKPKNHHIFPPTTMVQVEQTHNRCGGTLFPPEVAQEICQLAKERNIFSYMDGARLWNAAVASGQTVADLAAPFDAVMVSFSKGLGAPGGSMLVGDNDFIERAVRFRRMFGGAMRQTGYYAATARFALSHNMARLTDDHANAKALAARLAECPHLTLNPDSVQTNIVVFELTTEAIRAGELVRAAKAHGVLINALGRNTVRLVTHKDVSRADCEHAADQIIKILSHQPIPNAA